MTIEDLVKFISNVFCLYLYIDEEAYLIDKTFSLDKMKPDVVLSPIGHLNFEDYLQPGFTQGEVQEVFIRENNCLMVLLKSEEIPKKA